MTKAQPPIEPAAVIAALDDARSRASFDAPAIDAARLAAFVAELFLWNARSNLIRVASAEELAIRHVLDSLIGAPLLPHGARVADIGAGGGFPGVILALAREDIRVVAIESVAKKAAFLNHVRRTLSIANFEVVSQRAESVDAQSFDAAVTRAAAPLGEIVPIAKRLVRAGGAAWFWTTPEDAAAFGGVEIALRYTLPGQTRERVIARVGC
ncbi:16S rRNA (guanine(527)-N(7))-methyltransferase RsmG [bacterium]|nr:16S rRNA (guanine(527)-N(7))-methyltransferase RsmG [bacterium]